MSDQDEFSENPVIHAVHGRRRRSFLAVKPEAPLDIDTVPAALDLEEDDIPVLTEVVPPDAPVEAEATEPVEPVEPVEPDEPASVDPMIAVEARIEELAADMARAIAEQMAYDLPTLIEATLLNAGAELRSGITATMETALREYIAQRKQLNLPLEDAKGAEDIKDPANDWR